MTKEDTLTSLDKPSHGLAISAAEAKFELFRHRAGMVLAPVVFVAVYLLLGDSLSPEGRRLSAILAGVITLWLTETIPLPATAILGATLCIILGVADARTVLAPFADPIIFLFLGSFMLVQAMLAHGLDRRLALLFLSLPGVAGGPLRLMAAVGFVTAVLSMWVSNTATAAMMLPITLGIIRAMEGMREKPEGGAARWPFATGMVLIIAYAASVGGIATPVGSPPNLIGIGLIHKLANVEISFFDWMSFGLPLCAVMFIVLVAVMYWLHPPGAMKPKAATTMRDYLRDRRALLGPWRQGEINTVLVFCITVSLWLAPGIAGIALGREHHIAKLLHEHFPEAAVSLLAVSLLFLIPVSLKRNEFTLNWQQAVGIDWGTILLFGGGLSLGGLMFSTGVAESLGKNVTELAGAQSVWALTAVAIAVGIVLTEATSNTAAANMLVPVVIALAQAAGVNPVIPALGVCMAANFGFMMPVGTPPNAIVYSSGLVPLPRMLRAGILLNLIGFVLIFATLWLLSGLVGVL